MIPRLSLLIASVALLVFSFAALAAVTGPARAQDLGPAFSGGDFPLLSFSAHSVAYNSPPTLYTVPSGKKLVVNTFCLSTTSWSLGVNGSSAVDPVMTRQALNDDSQPLFCSGSGSYVLDAGDVLSVRTTSTSSSAGGSYYVEARLVSE